MAIYAHMPGFRKKTSMTGPHFVLQNCSFGLKRKAERCNTANTVDTVVQDVLSILDFLDLHHICELRSKVLSHHTETTDFCSTKEKL